jgi:P27 family predicted phage terminase small subunit
MRGRKPSEIVPGSSPVRDVPRVPVWLSKEAKTTWRSAARIMTERGTLTEGDLPTLEAYCEAVALVRQTTRQLAGTLTYETAGGLIKKHPAVSILDAAIKSVRQLAAELGLTPIARSRAAITSARGDLEEADDLGLD